MKNENSEIEILNRKSNLTPIEKAILNRIERIRILIKDELLTGTEAAGQIWAMRDVLTQVDPESKIIPALLTLEAGIITIQKLGSKNA